MVDRIILLSQFPLKKYKRSYHYTTDGYPLPFIFLAIHTRLKYHYQKSNKGLNYVKQNKIKERFFTIPCVKIHLRDFPKPLILIEN